MNKVKIVAIVLAMICAGTIPVLAYMYFFETEPTYIASGVILQSYPTPNVTLGCYLDQACTQPVTTIDFGEMIHPDQMTYIWRTIYIRNEGDIWCDIHWNSTLSSATMEIEECWNYEGQNWGWPSIEGIRLDSGGNFSSNYGIRIPAYTSAGIYNWTLTVWGVHYY